MLLKIETFHPAKLVGMRVTTTLNNNKTFELWRSFMPRRKEIAHTINPVLFSMQRFAAGQKFENFGPDIPHEKWAAVEVSNFDELPVGMEKYVLSGGLYAVFLYKGRPKDFADTWRYIFLEWLPNSEYEADDREHFELLGEKYKNNDPDSEEEVWIPIRRKRTE